MRTWQYSQLKQMCVSRSAFQYYTVVIRIPDWSGIQMVECINFDQIFKLYFLKIRQRQRHFILFRINKYHFPISKMTNAKTI